MASVSYSISFGSTGAQDLKPEDFAVGASGPGVGDVEIRVNAANVPTLKDLELVLEGAIRRLQDSRYGVSDFGVL